MNGKAFFAVTRWARALRFWLLLGAAVLAWLGFGMRDAAAHTMSAQVCPPAAGCTRPAALAACLSRRAEFVAAHPEWTPVEGCQYDAANRSYFTSPGVPAHGGYIVAEYWRNDECPAGTQWRNATQSCRVPCNQEDPITNAAWGGDAGACKDGCFYSMDISSPARGWIEAGERYNWGTLRPDGSTCTVDSQIAQHKPDKPTCVATGGQNRHCALPDGRNCVTDDAGNTFCFDPSRLQIRSTSDGSRGASNSLPGETAPPPPNMKDPTSETGPTINNNNGCQSNCTTRITTWTGGGGGSKPGQGDVGTGGCDTTQGNCTGGSGTGNGNGNGDDDGVGQPGEGVGDLYSPTEKTVGSVVSDYFTRVGETPIISAGAAFFDISASGSCPVFTATILGRSISIDFYCRAEFQPVWQGMGIFMLVIFSWAAFRVGFLD